ncbi:hypothetical protein Vadar_021345 [Vaccinium darrowii]|uniref:Uncharacterized protein n=1 Tax=Vaccinium darrowii TaxID=229202 RepID=A0ACB7XS91_9ERIC|nr:hypothetical protein Vadar_021345 [Vaccinium darrowii]
MIKAHHLSLIGILEAKARIDNVAQIAKCCFLSHWSVEHNIPNNRVARMMVAWDGRLLKEAFIHSSSQLMVAKVITEDGSLFFVSFVYGQNLLVERRALWEEMKQISSVVGDNPWIQLGDFNVVRKRFERLVGFDNNVAMDFNDCLDIIGMDDMPFKGMWFTWSNKRGGMDDIKSKLDRVLINAAWMDKFSKSEAMFLALGVSDHSFILVTVLPDVPRQRSFKFFSFWMKHTQFKEEVMKSWWLPMAGSSCLRLCEKLRRLKPVLKAFNKKFFSRIGERVCQAREELIHVQEQCARGPYDSALVDIEQELYVKFVEWSLAEESFKKQKSRVQWLSLGDQNTRFFHVKMKSRYLRNKILGLTDANGVRLTDPTDVQGEILGYYIGLLGSPFEQQVDATQVLNLAVSHRLMSVMKESLTKPITGAEKKAAMLLMRSGPVYVRGDASSQRMRIVCWLEIGT